MFSNQVKVLRCSIQEENSVRSKFTDTVSYTGTPCSWIGCAKRDFVWKRSKLEEECFSWNRRNLSNVKYLKQTQPLILSNVKDSWSCDNQGDAKRGKKIWIRMWKNQNVTEAFNLKSDATFINFFPTQGEFLLLKPLCCNLGGCAGVTTIDREMWDEANVRKNLDVDNYFE